MTEQELYKELRRKNGDRAQQAIAIEEMAELTQAIIKDWRDIEKLARTERRLASDIERSIKWE